MKRIRAWWEKYQYKVFGLVLWSILIFFWYSLYRYSRLPPAEQCALSCRLSYPGSPTGLWLCQSKCRRPKMKGDSAADGGVK